MILFDFDKLVLFHIVLFLFHFLLENWLVDAVVVSSSLHEFLQIFLVYALFEVLRTHLVFTYFRPVLFRRPIE